MFNSLQIVRRECLLAGLITPLVLIGVHIAAYLSGRYF